MPTLAAMRTDVLNEADLVTGQVDNSVVDSILNGELSDLYEILCDEYEGWNRTDAALTITAGLDEVSLPADFFRVIDVTDLVQPATPRSLLPFEFKDRHTTYDKRYCIDGTKLMIRPTAIAPGAYTLSYQPTYTTLVADGDVFTVPNKWERWAVFGTALRLRSMQELSGGDLEQRRAEVETKIKSRAAKRKGPRKARDVRLYRSGAKRGKDWGYDP